MQNDTDIELIIEKLSTNGQEELDRAYTKQLKAYCKSLGMNQDDAFNKLGRLVLHQLKKEHAQIRYGSLLIIEYLFERSHLFRLFICEHLDSFFKLCFDVKGFNYLDKYEQLPESSKYEKNLRMNKKKILQPVLWTKKLRAKSLECYLYWHREFASAYKVLINGFRFLERQGVISSESANTSISSQRVNLSDSSELLSQRSQVERLTKEFEEIESDANILITQIDTCFDLLIPKFKITEDAHSAENFHFRPMQGLSFSIILNSKVEISRDSSNSDIIDNLKEFCRELNKFFLGNFSTFYQNIIQLKVPLATDIFKDLLNNVKCLKVKIATIIWKFNEINIITPTCDLKFDNVTHTDNKAEDDEDDEDEDEDDFEEVPDREELFLIKKIEKEKDKDKEMKTANKIILSTEQHSEISVHQCRAPLPSGKLCPRRDNLKCPFHGQIIPRGIDGLPIDDSLRKKELDIRFQQESDQWKDPKYLKQLSIQTGRDLEGKNFKNKRKKYPNLIDIKKLENTPRKRLMRKICSTKMREKISNDLTKLDEQAHRQYSEQWAYAFEN